MHRSLGAIMLLCGQFKDYCTKLRCDVCAGKSMDCSNPYFEHNIYIIIRRLWRIFETLSIIHVRWVLAVFDTMWRKFCLDYFPCYYSFYVVESKYLTMTFCQLHGHVLQLKSSLILWKPLAFYQNQIFTAMLDICLLK